jgi:hypothetical protein
MMTVDSFGQCRMSAQARVLHHLINELQTLHESFHLPALIRVRQHAVHGAKILGHVRWI